MRNLLKINILSFALILCACEELKLPTGNDDLSSIENGRTLSGKIVNIEDGEIDSVAIICYYDNGWGDPYVLSISAVSPSGEFELSLPIPSDLEKIGDMFSNGFSGTISDELAHIFQEVGSEVSALKNGIEIGSILK